MISDELLDTVRDSECVITVGAEWLTIAGSRWIIKKSLAEDRDVCGEREIPRNETTD